MALNATITAKSGPGIQATSLVLTNCRGFQLDAMGEVLYVTLADGQVRDFSVSPATTWTLTVSGTTYTLTVVVS